MNQDKAIDLARQAAKEALKEYDKEKKRIAKSKTFRNTKLLMENYNAIKSVVEKGVSETTQLDVDVNTDLDEDKIFIASIRRSKLKSLIMLTHIDNGLDELGKEQRLHNTYEKYCALTYYYFKGITEENIAEIFNCAAITIHRWKNEMLNKLGVYIFGVDGLDMD